jgi:tripartite-type tricarboxylate transporter receptor subunit TctC
MMVFITTTQRSRWRRARRFAAVGLLMALSCGGARAQAQPYPDRPIKLIVPWPAGGATDLAGRIFAQQMAIQLHASFVVENRPGATGMVGTAVVAHAPADGYTLLLASAETHAINPFTYDKLSYDPIKDFIPIAPFAVNPYAIVARADFPAKTTADFVATVRKSPGKYTYASASLGSASQIVMEMFRGAAHLDILHVPFQGEAPGLTALMGGQVDFMVLPAGRAMAVRTSGKIKVYAVTMATRFAGMPDVPTLSEEGFKTIQIANWFSLMAPAKTPAPVVQKLADAVAATLGVAQTSTALNALGLSAFSPMTQPDFVKFVSDERARWGDVIKRANIHAGN